jgi:hypothetical protein
MWGIRPRDSFTMGENIKIYLWEIAYEYWRWLELAQDCIQ